MINLCITNIIPANIPIIVKYIHIHYNPMIIPLISTIIPYPMDSSILLVLPSGKLT